MLSLICVIPFFAFLLWLFRRHPALIAAQVLMLFSFTLRVLSALYIDVAGPVYSTDLGFDLGPGTSSSIFVLSTLSVLVITCLIYRRVPIRPEKIGQTLFGMSPRHIAHAAFVALVVLVLADFGEMFASGHIPLLEGMDRLEYDSRFAGVFYQSSYSYQFLIASALGCFFVLPRIGGGDYDYRFLFLLAALFLFFAMTGNRFSIFVGYTNFFGIGASAVLMAKDKGIAIPQARSRGIRKFLSSKAAQMLMAGCVSLTLGALVLNSFFNVRYAGDAELGRASFFQRSLVQPIELYQATWQRWVNGEISNTSLAWDIMFNNPIDPTRNTGIQFLMVANLGEQRATVVLDQDSQSAGGYPEVLIELFGVPWFVLPQILAALIYGGLTVAAMFAACYGRIFTMLMTLYILVAFVALYIGGMLNFLLPVLFWVKVGVWLVVTILEPRFMRVPRGRRARPLPAGLASARGTNEF